VLALLQLLLADVAAEKCVAVLVNAVCEVLAGHADGSTSASDPPDALQDVEPQRC
jgi:hypothetical protein